MGEKRKRNAEDARPTEASYLSAPTSSLDPSLSSLFASSSGPVQVTPIQYPSTRPRDSPIAIQEEATEPSHAEASTSESGSVSSSSTSQFTRLDLRSTIPRKRRRIEETDDLESKYLDRLAREDSGGKVINGVGLDADDEPVAEDVDSGDDEDNGASLPPPKDVPLHESLAQSTVPSNYDNSSRTVFLGNVSSQAVASKSARKTLLKHLSTFLPALPAKTGPHKLESLRFRSVAFAAGIPKKAAYAKGEIMDMTTKSTNAYAVYSSETAAKAATRKLNGSVVLDRHLRVDLVSQPAKIDHSRCIFVGNLNFVNVETTEDTVEGENGKTVKQTKRKSREPADAEEGLWRTFGNCGTVESVRVIRDKSTRVGKGFAYVQFTNMNAVEAALLYNDKKFPPLLPRKLRVMRAKNIKRKATSDKQHVPRTRNSVSKQKSFNGTLSKLASQASASTGGRDSKRESFVFEGHRASQTKDKVSGKVKRRKRKPDPNSRTARRTAAFKAAGGKPGGKSR